MKKFTKQELAKQEKVLNQIHRSVTLAKEIKKLSVESGTPVKELLEFFGMYINHSLK